jgi:hypothetical protein
MLFYQEHDILYPLTSRQLNGLEDFALPSLSYQCSSTRYFVHSLTVEKFLILDLVPALCYTTLSYIAVFRFCFLQSVWAHYVGNVSLVLNTFSYPKTWATMTDGGVRTYLRLARPQYLRLMIGPGA